MHAGRSRSRRALGEPHVWGLGLVLQALPGLQNFPLHLDTGPLDRGNSHPAGKRYPGRGVS